MKKMLYFCKKEVPKACRIANSMYLMEHKAQLTNGGLPVRVWVQVFGDTFRLAWTAAHFFYYKPTLVCCSRVV